MSDEDDISLYFIIDKEGNIHEFAISLLEDLWHDYMYFIGQAELHKDGKSDFLSRRYLRVALLILFTYAEAVINHWCHIIKSAQNEPPEKIKKFIRHTSLLYKSEFVTEEIKKTGPSIKHLQLSTVKELRNEVVHLKPSNDLSIFIEITFEVVKAAEREVVGWIESIECNSNLVRHPNTKYALDDFDGLGNVTGDNYTH